MTAACNEDPARAQQLVGAQRHSGVKVHRESRQLWSEADRLTSDMSHVHSPSEGLLTGLMSLLVRSEKL